MPSVFDRYVFGEDPGESPSLLDRYLGQMGAPLTARKPGETPAERVRRLLAHVRAAQAKARELEGPDPGLSGMLGANLRENVIGPLAGLAERARILPAGTRQGMRAGFEATRERYLSEREHEGIVNPEGGLAEKLTAVAVGPGGLLLGRLVGRPAVEYVAELASAAAPVALGGAGAGRAVGGALLRVGAGRTAARVAGGAAGGVLEGGLTGLGDTAGLGTRETLTGVGLGAALGGAAGGLGGAAAARAATRKATPASQDAASFLARYTRRDEPASWGDRLSAASQRFYRDFVDELNPIGRLGKRGGRGADDPVRRNLDAMIQQVRAESDLSLSPIHRHTRRVNAQTGDVEVTGESLAHILKGLEPETQDDLAGYLLALRHTEDLAGRAAGGERVKVNDAATADSVRLVERLSRKYGVDPASNRVRQLDELADRYRDWTKRAFLDPLEDAGVLNATQRAAIEAKNQHYAIFKRTVDHLEAAGIRLDAYERAGRRGAKVPRQGSPVKRIHGGLDEANPVGDPITEAAIQAMRVARFAARQQVRNAVVDLAQANPGLFPELAPAPKQTRKVARVDVDELVAKHRRAAGREAMAHAGSASSPEAISRQAGGTRFYEVSPGGDVRPLIGVDAVDVRPRKGYAKVRRSANGELVVEEGKLSETARRRLTDQLGGETPQRRPPSREEPDVYELDLEEPPAKLGEADVYRTQQVDTETFAHWRDGERTLWHAKPDLLRALNHVGPRQLPWVLKPLQFLTRLKRAGATLSPEFIVRNPGRDQISAAVYSKHGFIPFWDAGRGLFHVLRRDHVWQEALDSGAFSSTFVALDRAAVRTDLGEAARAGQTSTRKAISYLNPIRVLQAVSDFAEKATRVGEFELARRGGRTTLGGLPIPGTLGRYGSGRPIAEAGVDAADVTLNFSRAGGYGRIWNSVEAFANAEIQDVDKFARAFRRDPGGTLLKGLVYITLPSALHALKWKEDKDYHALPEWDRMLFYHLGRTSDGGFFRFPRPLGLLNVAFGYLPEQGLHYLQERDPHALEDMAKALTEQTPVHFLRTTEDMVPIDLVPSALEPLIEVFANKDPFRGADVIPLSEQRELPETQGAERAGETAVLGGQAARSPLGRALGLDKLTAGGSPLAVQHLIRGYGASLGRLGQEASDLAIRWAQGSEAPPPAPAQPLGGVPLVRAFVSRPPYGFGSKPVTDFYRLAELAEQSANSYKRHPPRNAGAWLAEHPEAHLAQPLSRVREELTELRKARIQIIESRVLDPAQKAAQLAIIDQYITQLAAAQMHAASDALARFQARPEGR